MLAAAAVVWATLAPATVTAQTSATITGEVRSADGAAIPGAEVTVASETLQRQVATDADGGYRLPALPAGTYEVRASADGFAPAVRSGFELLLNSRVELDFELEVGTVEDEVTVTGAPVLLDTQSSDTGGVVTPLQIATLPVNGRDYLDLMQLVPGVQVNREKDKGSDEAVPVLGERAGNAVYLIDGMPNRDEFGSGAASQFTQDSIQEFEVLTGGFKAEFGHGSGGVVNVVTKGGGNQWRGAVVGFVRDDGMDSSNSLEEMAETPSLSRDNFALNLGGPLVGDRAFIFASAEQIDEERELNFAFPPATPAVLRDFENSFDFPATTDEDRYFLKLTEQVGDRHRLDQQISVSDSQVNDFLPLSAAANLPSTRKTSGVNGPCWG
ncbi:MAG: carboxypeptidase regulatory-like domain-containing protein [Acidobacteriota bacterium]|nr:carboxypeptidase regulatory-like domain-containing protein [Acidobacteriota bacterium]